VGLVPERQRLALRRPVAGRAVDPRHRRSRRSPPQRARPHESRHVLAPCALERPGGRGNAVPALESPAAPLTPEAEAGSEPAGTSAAREPSAGHRDHRRGARAPSLHDGPVPQAPIRRGPRPPGKPAAWRRRRPQGLRPPRGLSTPRPLGPRRRNRPKRLPKSSIPNGSLLIASFIKTLLVLQGSPPNARNTTGPPAQDNRFCQGATNCSPLPGGGRQPTVSARSAPMTAVLLSAPAPDMKVSRATETVAGSIRLVAG